LKVSLERFLAPPPERFGAQEASFFARWFCFSSPESFRGARAFDTAAAI